MFQGSSWQRCRVHFLRNLLSHVPNADKFLKGSPVVCLAFKLFSRKRKATLR
jgi:transposase-like protein